MTGNPFDDPEIQAAMAEAGITHKPGLAAEMLEQLAPLLAAEGIDLDDPDSDVDLETLNEALGRATERHNLQLLTPVGSEEERAHAVIAEFSEKLTRRRTRDAEAVLDSIEPEPTRARPAASHVIGASLGLLDAWYTDADLGPWLDDVPIPTWRGPARSLAASLISAARQGSAFASLDQLIARHGGRFVMDAGMLAAAATIHASARGAGEDVPGAAERLLHRSSSSGSAGAASGLVPESVEAGTELSRRFGAWLAKDRAGAVPAGAGKGALFEQFAAVVEQSSLDLEAPGDIEEVIDVIFELGSREVAELALDMLHDYVHFQQETSADPAAWAQAHELVEDALAGDDPMGEALTEALARSRDVDPRVRREALGRLGIVAGLKDLIAWLARPRPITASRGLRLADIEAVAAMIDVSAVGVTGKKPPQEVLAPSLEPPEPSPDAIRARSIKDVPVLDAWWRALETVEAIELTASRVRLRAEAPMIEADGLPSLVDAEMLVSIFLAEFLVGEAGNTRHLELPALLLTLTRLTAAVAPEDYAVGSEAEEFADLLGPWVDHIVDVLGQIGLVEVDEAGTVIVPEPLRGAVAGGVLATLTTLMDEDDPDA